MSMRRLFLQMSEEAESDAGQQRSAASELRAARRKSSQSNPSENCMGVAALPDGAIAVRNSCHPSGLALIHTRAEISVFLTG